MSDQPFTFPLINFAAAAQRSDIRYCELLRLVAAHWVQDEQHEDDKHLIESKDQYFERLNTKIKLLRDLMNNAIDAGDIISSKRTATAEMKELEDLQETLYAFGVNQDDFSTDYDIRDNLDINIRSFTFWAAEKRILLPAAFYTIYQIEPPKPLVHAVAKSSTDTENTKVKEGLLKILIAIVIDAYGYDPNVKKSTVTQDILNALSSCNLSLSENTIRNRLKEAAELLPRE